MSKKNRWKFMHWTAQQIALIIISLSGLLLAMENLSVWDEVTMNSVDPPNAGKYLLKSLICIVIAIVATYLAHKRGVLHLEEEKKGKENDER